MGKGDAVSMTSTFFKVLYTAGMVWLYVSRPAILGVAIVATLLAALVVRAHAARRSH